MGNPVRQTRPRRGNPEEDAGSGASIPGARQGRREEAGLSPEARPTVQAESSCSILFEAGAESARGACLKTLAGRRLEGCASDRVRRWA